MTNSAPSAMFAVRGQAVGSFYELVLNQVPFPSPADAAYLVFPFGACACLLLFPTEHTGSSRGRAASRSWRRRSRARCRSCTPTTCMRCAWAGGSSPEVDEAIRLHPDLEAFLRQGKEESTTLIEGYQRLEQLLDAPPG